MALSPDDLQEIKLYAREAARQICAEVIHSHIDSCPHGKLLISTRSFFLGAIAAASLAGSSVGAILVKVFSKS